MPGQEPSSSPENGDNQSNRSASASLSDAADMAKQETASFVDAAKDKAVDKIAEKKGSAGEALADFAEAIRSAGDQLSRSDRSTASDLVRQAADGLEGMARTISEKRPEELLQAMREFGRDNPTALFAGSVLAGVALGRFFRASDASGGGASSPQEQGTRSLSASDLSGGEAASSPALEG